MNFLCTGITKQLYDTTHRVTANNRIIHQNHSFAFYAFFYSIKFDFHTVKSCSLTGRDKSSPIQRVYRKPGVPGK